jgi:hypothetical protein
LFINVPERTHTWLESARGVEFDTGDQITAKDWEQPFQNYRYPHDLRNASGADITHLKKHFTAGMKAKNRQ